MFFVNEMAPVILAVIELQRLSFRFVLDMSGSDGDRDTVAAVFALQLQHQSHRRDQIYVAGFRARYGTFLKHVSLLGQDTRWRGAITDPHRVAIALYRLAHGAAF